MELKRDIYKRLLEWKRENTHKVLELEGARQVGKTFILDKFAKENYKVQIYVNMAQTSGQEFLACLEQATAWQPGMKRKERPIHEALSLFHGEFEDNKDTIVVIDEIQESSKVYSMIRQFAREFECDFIVTGSYLGKTREKDFFLSAGDVDSLTMTSLTFAEFLEAAGKRELYETIDLYGASDHAQYDELKHWFDVYLHIGGYPEVVKAYLETGNLEQCADIIESLIRIFVKESGRYFESPLETATFEKVFSSIATMMLKEKKGTKDLITDLTSIIFKEESGRIAKKTVNYAISWLYLSHQLGYCSKSVNCDNLNIVENCRYYFMDLGIANYFLSLTGSMQETIDGCLCENFVYLMLLERIRRREIAGQVPWFGTDEESSGELDFYVRSRLNHKNYGLEVKRGNEIAVTANKLLDKGRLDFVYSLKNTYGGINEDKRAVPLYLAGRIPFDC
ncbi:ATP-binding protein [Clostridium sp. AF27-2AA]|uniref:ATP-binding protein n=1 Tax=Clostridium sp. AF27-2AA TaxID=2292206 RepID=UPI000E525EFE|nr:AAA family ATPase [Clostridium sp. AF27-2AA]RHQ35396.1 ATP-binding protein [Clostridium sp. AF27-2AA]